MLAIGSLCSAGLSVLGGSTGVRSALGVGLAAGFIGSIAGQTAANLLGMQRGIDFGGALLSGLATAATAGIGYGLKQIGALHNLSTIGNKYDMHYFSASSAFELMEQNAASQAFNTTLRRHQDYKAEKSIAASHIQASQGDRSVKPCLVVHFIYFL